MVKIALVKNDGTWEEKKLRIKVDYFHRASMSEILRYLEDHKYLTETREFPEGIISIAILPLNWSKKKE
jgi:homogentisate 1,2-dioxygenase